MLLRAAAYDLSEFARPPWQRTRCYVCDMERRCGDCAWLNMLSQEAFADKCRVHRTYMGVGERGEVNISLDNIQKIAPALDVAVSALFAEAEQSSKQSS